MSDNQAKFEVVWQSFVARKGTLHDESARLTITVGNLKFLSRQFFDQGVKSVEKEKSPSFDFLSDLFGGHV